jgi:hypothetical protein
MFSGLKGVFSCELNPLPPRKRDFRLVVDPERFDRSGEKRMVASYRRVAQRTEAFLVFRGSRPGLFSDLPARETCPLHCSSRLLKAESQGFPHR